MRTLLVVLGVVAALAIVTWLVLGIGTFDSFTNPDQSEGENNVVLESIISFEGCAEAGFAVRESYPRQCSTPDGRVFAEEIEVSPTYDNASADMIEVFSPHPGGVVGKEFLVVGMARGNWFFEVCFPFEVIRQNGNQIGGGVATATGDWMTTDFVEFKTDLIDLPSAYMGPATLVLRRDNPSGLPENDASISIPIVVEY